MTAPSGSWPAPAPGSAVGSGGIAGRARRQGSAAASALWLVLGSALVLATLTWGTYSVVVVLAHDTYDVHQVFAPGEVTAVEVANAAGRVTITGVDGDVATLDAHVSRGLRATEHVVAVEGGVLVVQASCPNFGSDFCSASTDLQVPRGVPVTVRRGDARITLTGLDGPVDVRSSNGSIVASDLSGVVRLHSSNGRIEADGLRSRDVEATSGNGRVVVTSAVDVDRLVASSTNGRVEVVVPDTGVAYRLDASSAHGSVRRDIATDPGGERTITATSSNGSVTVRYP